MAHEPLHALVLFVLLFGVKWAAINGEESTERTIVCLEDFQDLFPPGFLFFEPVHPVAVILMLEFQFVGDHPPCQFVRRHSESLAIRLGECGRSEHNDGHYNGCGVVYQSHNRWRRQCATRFDPVIHVAIFSVRRTLRTDRRSASLSSRLVPHNFHHRTTCAQKLFKIAHSPSTDPKDCLLNPSRAALFRQSSTSNTESSPSRVTAYSSEELSAVKG